MDKTAAIIVIGNEILSGKVVDTNAAFLARELRQLGVTLQRILVVPDEAPAIAKAIRHYRDAYDFVFTSGGVGPTHDDITMESVALGLDRPLVIHPELEKMIRRYVPGEVNRAHLKMAEVPEGAELIHGGKINFPTVAVDNIYILPGIPELFHDKFEAIKDRFVADPYYLRVIYLSAIETNIASYLNETLAQFPALLLGSYPKMSHPEYSVRVTLESKDPAYVDRAFADLLSRFPAGMVVRTE